MNTLIGFLSLLWEWTRGLVLGLNRACNWMIASAGGMIVALSALVTMAYVTLITSANVLIGVYTELALSISDGVALVSSTSAATAGFGETAFGSFICFLNYMIPIDVFLAFFALQVSCFITGTGYKIVKSWLPVPGL